MAPQLAGLGAALQAAGALRRGGWRGAAAAVQGVGRGGVVADLGMLLPRRGRVQVEFPQQIVLLPLRLSLPFRVRGNTPGFRKTT